MTAERIEVEMNITDKIERSVKDSYDLLNDLFLREREQGREDRGLSQDALVLLEIAETAQRSPRSRKWGWPVGEQISWQQEAEATIRRLESQNYTIQRMELMRQ